MNNFRNPSDSRTCSCFNCVKDEGNKRKRKHKEYALIIRYSKIPYPSINHMPVLQTEKMKTNNGSQTTTDPNYPATNKMYQVHWICNKYMSNQWHMQDIILFLIIKKFPRNSATWFEA